jgi:hypothetical protein
MYPVSSVTYVPGLYPGGLTLGPAITVPMGYRRRNTLSIGITFVGRPWSEGRLIGLAYGYEQATHHRRARPYRDTAHTCTPNALAAILKDDRAAPAPWWQAPHP